MKKILVVDDDPAVCKMLEEFLSKKGYEVRVETKGKFGLAAAKEFRPDLIFADIAMPDFDGGELIHQLEQDESVKDIPTVFLTALATKQDSGSGGLVIGGRVVISKSITTKELIACIEKNIRK